jgi:hypothetical protein
VTPDQLYHVKLIANGDSSSKETKEDTRVVLTLERNLIDLALGSNGKAELYFHAYFWYTFAVGIFSRTAETPDSTEAFD